MRTLSLSLIVTHCFFRRRPAELGGGRGLLGGEEEGASAIISIVRLLVSDCNLTDNKEALAVCSAAGGSTTTGAKSD